MARDLLDAHVPFRFFALPLRSEEHLWRRVGSTETFKSSFSLCGVLGKTSFQEESLFARHNSASMTESRMIKLERKESQ